MDAHRKADAILLSGLSSFSAAVEMAVPSLALVVADAETIAAGLSSFCFSLADGADAAAVESADLLSKKGEPDLPAPFFIFHLLLFSFMLQSRPDFTFRRHWFSLQTFFIHLINTVSINN